MSDAVQMGLLVEHVIYIRFMLGVVIGELLFIGMVLVFWAEIATRKK